jgi:hypothetical protein
MDGAFAHYARLHLAGKAVEVALPADSVTSLTWR